MKPTMSTSPLTWSCTTAGIKPSSFEKSITCCTSCTLCTGQRPVRTDPCTNKNPASTPAGSALRLVIREVLVFLTRAVLPDDPDGRGDDGRARVPGIEPLTSEAYQMKWTERNRLERSACDVRVGFDFDEHVRVDQLGDLHHGCRRPDGSEELAVHPADFLPSTDVGDVHARPDDILESGASLLQCGLDVAKRLQRLRAHIAFADDSPVRIRRRRPGNMNMAIDAH